MHGAWKIPEMNRADFHGLHKEIRIIVHVEWREARETEPEGRPRGRGTAGGGMKFLSVVHGGKHPESELLSVPKEHREQTKFPCENEIRKRSKSDVPASLIIASTNFILIRFLRVLYCSSFIFVRICSVFLGSTTWNAARSARETETLPSISLSSICIFFQFIRVFLHYKKLLFLFQAVAETDQELCRVAHRIGLLHRQDLRRAETSAADRNDERLSQLPYHLSGGYLEIKCD